MGDAVELICEVKENCCTGWDASSQLGEGDVFFIL